MKLSKKVPILILPVLVCSFLLTALGLFLIERDSVYSLTRSGVELEATELSGKFSQYTLVAGGFLASIVQSDSLIRFLATEDEQLRSMALSSGLDSLLMGLGTLSSDYFSVVFTNGKGELEYYYENSYDPFAEPSQRLLDWGRKQLDGLTHSTSQYLTDEKIIVFRQTIDRITLRQTTDYASENSITILVSLRPSDFLKRWDELNNRGHLVSYYPKNMDSGERGTFESRRNIPGFGTIGVEVEKYTVDNELKTLFIKFGAVFAILIALAHGILQWLLQQHVIRPIHGLEEQLSSIDLDSTQEVTVIRSKDEIGNLSKTFAVLYEKLKKTYEDTRELAEKDTLTTLYNRRIFGIKLEGLLSRAERENSFVAMMYLDIDNFKFVNDTYGHTVGDCLLRSFALRLNETVRGKDLVFGGLKAEATAARLAGDEFAVILHGYSDEDVPRKAAQRLLKICENGFTCDEGSFPVSLSIGVATYPHDGTSQEELTINADSAMYEAKKSGKNAISYFSRELSDFAKQQQQLEVELKKLKFEEFELYYMPIVQAGTGEIKLLEALIRWNSPVLGSVSPAQFIPLAENIGLFHEVDMWVIERAFRDWSMLSECFGSGISISINISAAELSKDDFAIKLFSLLERYSLKPSMFTFEITETFYQDHSQVELALLNELRGKGFKLAIDDFGSGYTSLLQLVEFPVHTVKLDKAFIEKTVMGGKEPVLKSLVDFCHSQHIQVTAEGVETEEYVEKLTEAGCDYLQGYYFAKPLPVDELQQQP